MARAENLLADFQKVRYNTGKTILSGPRSRALRYQQAGSCFYFIKRVGRFCVGESRVCWGVLFVCGLASSASDLFTRKGVDEEAQIDVDVMVHLTSPWVGNEKIFGSGRAARLILVQATGILWPVVRSHLGC